MSFLSRLPRIKASSAPTDDKWYYPGGNYYGGLIPSFSGMAVSSETAMRLITVQNCIRVRYYTIGQLPCHIIRRKGEMREEAEDFYLYKILHDEPNSWMSSFDFFGMLEAHICLCGNFYVFILRSTIDNSVLELSPIPYNAVEKITQNEDSSLTYKIKMKDGQTKDYSQDKILHFRGVTLDGIVGVNPIEYARETTGLGMASQVFLSKYFGKGLHPSAIITYPGQLNTQTHTNLREGLKEKYAGIANAQDLMLLEMGMKIEFPPIKLVDAQFLELTKMNEAQICGLYRVPLMLVQSSDRTETFASASQFFLNYSVYGVTPDCVNYEKTMRRSLLNSQEKKKYYMKFNIDGLLRGDFETRMKGFQTAINAEIMNPNECRAKMEMNPYKGGNEFRTRTSSLKQTESSKSSKTEKSEEGE